jgi:hypothetical protein
MKIQWIAESCDEIISLYAEAWSTTIRLPFAERAYPSIPQHSQVLVLGFKIFGRNSQWIDGARMIVTAKNENDKWLAARYNR